MAVRDELAGGGTRVGEAEAVHDVVEAEFKELKKDFARDATAAGCFFVVFAELAFKHAVLETELLLFGKHYAVVGLLLASGTHAVLTRGRGGGQRTCWGQKFNAETTRDFIAGTCITSHDKCSCM